MEEKPIGSGHFGQWVEDDFGQPAYEYTCHQASDPAAITPVNLVWRAPTEHSHQIGNDRLVAVVSNYGYVQVRQDEGSPKYLNDFHPAENQYAGGFGYLSDGQSVLSTYCGGNTGSFKRTFGTGYFKKEVSNSRYAVTQTIFAPYGDDPLLISRVDLTNKGDSAEALRWVEYWGNRIYQFSFRAMLISAATGGFGGTPEIRRRMAKAFRSQVEALGEGRGLLTRTTFCGWSEQDEQAWAMIEAVISSPDSERLGLSRPPDFKQSGARYEDLTPPPVFLVSLDGPAEGIKTDAAGFFGAGGAEEPDGMGVPFCGETSPPEGGAMLLERRFNLQPGESRSLFFAYGYLPAGHHLEKLLSRYSSGLEDLLADTCASWAKDRILLSVPEEPWVEREMKWHNYYLGSNLTYDDFFGEHILSQGHVYQYTMGFQGAARDPMQHALPFIYSRPWIAREVIRYTLKEIMPDGDIPYGIVGHGMIMPVSFKPSDSALWLLWLVAEYVLATRDHAFMEEMITGRYNTGKHPAKETVKQAVQRCYEYLVHEIGSGKHGLLRLSNGDWNDSVVLGHAEPEQQALVKEQGETVLNSAMAVYVFDLYALLLTCIGEDLLSKEVAAEAVRIREAVQKHWNGRWFKRAWLSAELGWIGDEELWLEPQPWAIIGRIATSMQTADLCGNIDNLLRQPSRIGAMLYSRGLKQMEKEGGVEAGVLTNGGVWPSINGTLIWALSRVDGAAAWDEWLKNTLCRHAEEYPEIWYGIWSGPDCYNSALSEHPGQTQFDLTLLPGAKSESSNFKYKGINWTDFPVMNMHPHCWPLYSALKLVGLELSLKGLEFSPRLPLKEYRLSSPLIGFAKSTGGFSGWYAPLKEGEWHILLRLPGSERYGAAEAEVNGQKVNVEREGQVFLLKGRGGQEKPLRWSLRFKERQ